MATIATTGPTAIAASSANSGRRQGAPRPGAAVAAAAESTSLKVDRTYHSTGSDGAPRTPRALQARSRGRGSGDRRRTWTITPTRAAELPPAKARREAITRRMAQLLESGAVLALPTLPGIAPPCNSAPAATEDFRARAMSLLCIAGLARLPQVSLPLASLDGRPLGLSLVGARGADLMLLALAKKLGAGHA